MTAFVILAAGRGTRVGRVGESLHKCLLPLDRRAVLSHLFELAPNDARLIVAVGHRANQVANYIDLAHPNRDVTLVDVPNWDQPDGGPGASLLACKDAVGDDDLYWTSCDTLWDPEDDISSDGEHSWAAWAPVPAGTHSSRWCWFLLTDDNAQVERVLDKTGKAPDARATFVGMGHVVKRDLGIFWHGIESKPATAEMSDIGETQVSGGLDALTIEMRLGARRIRWRDVGDAETYGRAVAELSGYDSTKPGEATYVLPEEGRVVKFWEDPTIAARRVSRAGRLGNAAPQNIGRADGFMVHDFVRGRTLYDVLDRNPNTGTITELLAFMHDTMWTRPRTELDDFEKADTARRFYQDKTLQRVGRLQRRLAEECRDALTRVDWDGLCERTVATDAFHGDGNFGNVIRTPEGRFVAIDWREDFGGASWGDVRHDLGKMLAGTYVHWDRSFTGNFRPWRDGRGYADLIRRWTTSTYGEAITRDVEIIAGLTMLSSAPLHLPPMDDVLVQRGVALMEDM